MIFPPGAVRKVATPTGRDASRRVIAGVDPDNHQWHHLHRTDRAWAETNCYVDLWIEVVHALGCPPEAMLGFTLSQNFEGDQFTFFKMPLEDLEVLYGIRVGELGVFDAIETHVATQVDRGRLCVVELDSYYLPDTVGVSYHTSHGKSSVAINRIDLVDGRMEYFHNAGYFEVGGDDFRHLFQLDQRTEQMPYLPYTEFATFATPPLEGERLREAARERLPMHLARRPQENPITAYAEVLPAQAEAVAERDFGFFHLYAFNTLRQLGANFELAADHFRWLSPEFALVVDDALAISTAAKTAQFKLARAVNRRRFDQLDGVLDPAAEAWARLMDDVARLA